MKIPWQVNSNHLKTIGHICPRATASNAHCLQHAMGEDRRRKYQASAPCQVCPKKNWPAKQALPCVIWEELSAVRVTPRLRS